MTDDDYSIKFQGFVVHPVVISNAALNISNDSIKFNHSIEFVVQLVV